MMRHSFNCVWTFVIAVFTSHYALAQDQGYEELKGNWQAVELVDNGRVMAADAIPGWLPSGGKIDIVDNTIVFSSPKDGQRHARVFSIDATTLPRQLNIFEQGKATGHGIYRIEDGRLAVCLSPVTESPRPDDFSAREGSKRVLIVFSRTESKASSSTVPAQPVSATAPLNLPAPPAVRPLTDVEIRQMLPGTWKCGDMYGAFFVTLDKNGIYSTYRETVETSAFQKVFRKLPLSSGTWKLNNGQVVLQSTSAVYADRLYKSFPFTVRSVNSTNMEFVDYAGNVGKAVRVQP